VQGEFLIAFYDAVVDESNEDERAGRGGRGAKISFNIVYCPFWYHALIANSLFYNMYTLARTNSEPHLQCTSGLFSSSTQVMFFLSFTMIWIRNQRMVHGVQGDLVDAGFYPRLAMGMIS
jgi:hypothetical protein